MKIRRYFKGWDCPDAVTADVFFVDRLTGKEISRYDGVDPANTDPKYGAISDQEVFERKGWNINEMIEEQQSVISSEKLNAMCRYDTYDV